MEHSRSTNGMTVPNAIAEQLDLDVTRAREAPLEVHARIAERRASFGAARADRPTAAPWLLDDAHAFTTSAGDSLDDQRITNRVRCRHDLLVAGACVERALGARNDRDAGAHRHLRAAVLLPMRAMASGDGPMKVRPASRQARSKRRILGEEPIARMNGVGAGSARDVEQRVDVEVAARRLVRSEIEAPDRPPGHDALRGRSQNRPRRSGAPSRGTRA